ncbi:MAG: hypothetical protein WAO52_06515 [Prolixibacteraceae bacterium]
MKTVVFSLLIAIFCLPVINSCTVEPDPKAEMNLTATLLGNPQCKGIRSADFADGTPNTQSCVEFSYNQALKILTLKHINAGFNCCPDSLSCTVTFRNDTIFIQEYEKNMGCKCNCLYDLDMEIEGVEPGKYLLKLIEPYAMEQQQLCFEVDLKNQNQGSYCVSRLIYPWGQ